METKLNTFFACFDKSRQVVRNVVAYGMVCMLLFAVVSCDASKESTSDESDLGTPTGAATGTIIAKYSHFNSASLIVQVDKQYPIGENICKYDLLRSCVELPSFYGYKTLQNLIQIQPDRRLPLPNRQKDEDLVGRRISFSYREFQLAEDLHLFVTSFDGPITAGCPSPDVPKFIITDIQILN